MTENQVDDNKSDKLPPLESDSPRPSLTIELPIEVDALEDSEIRDLADVNSPKRESIDVEPREDELTPTTMYRNKMGINSPRRSQIEEKGWAAANELLAANENSSDDTTDDDNDSNKNDSDKNDPDKNDPDKNDPTKNDQSTGPPSSALQSLVTQVPRDAAPITYIPQVPPEPPQSQTITKIPDQTEREIITASQSWGICTCFSCLLNCWQSDSTTSSTQYKKQASMSDGGQLDDPVAIRDENSDANEAVIQFETEGLLGRRLPQHRNQKCLVLDLDETLVHSSFKPVTGADFVIPVEIENVVHRVYVMKRPHADLFLERCAESYEVVIFTASLAKYANPLLDQLDPKNTVTHRLFRESCVIHQTAYVKDLTKLGRRLADTIIIDNSAQSYLFQPRNAIPITSWFDDKDDTELLDLLPVLDTTLKEVHDVRQVLDAHTKSYKWLCNQRNNAHLYN